MASNKIRNVETNLLNETTETTKTKRAERNEANDQIDATCVPYIYMCLPRSLFL